MPRHEQTIDGEQARGAQDMAEELRAIREVLDELREEVSWAIRIARSTCAPWSRALRQLASLNGSR